MKSLLFVLALPVLVACSSSALIVANTLARFDDYTLTTDISYGDHALNQLDIYQPDEPAKGTIVFFYGGCWGACTTVTRENYRFTAQALTSVGYIVVIPDYRLYPQVLFARIMEDSVAAVSWVKNNIDQYGGNANKLFLMGHSAGGHIAAMLTVNEQYLGHDIHQGVRGFVGLAAPYDFIFDKPYLQKLFSGMEYTASQPSFFVDGHEPPLLLLYGEDDTAVYRRNIDNMTRIVKHKGGQVETHIYKDTDHTDIMAALSIPFRGSYDVFRDITGFLDKQVKNEIIRR